MNTDLKYLIIEDSLKVCEGIVERMEIHSNWSACEFAHHVENAKRITSAEKPQLIFIDWALKGGSAYEVLAHIQYIPNYYPYIIFNTGYQSDNPEIPQEIVNNYKIDKYIVKPLWENLRKNLSTYLQEAENKILQFNNEKEIWLIDVNKKNTVRCDLNNLICICQQIENPYYKNFHFCNFDSILTVKFSWQAIIELLKENHVIFFITNSRQHLVVKRYINSYQRPYIKLKGFNQKVEVVKDKLHEFEIWLKS